MQRPYLVLAIAALSVNAFSACRSTSKGPDEQVETVSAELEIEPNNTPDQASLLAPERSLQGELTLGDVDYVRVPDTLHAIVVTVPSVTIGVEHSDGRRAELGGGAPGGVIVALPDAGWRIVLSGAGAWEVQHDPEPDRPYCGLQLGRGAAPALLTASTLPAVFPLCVTPSAHAGVVSLPALRPAGVVGLTVRLESAETSLTGTLRVLDGATVLAEDRLAINRALPPLRWSDTSALSVALDVRASTNPTTVQLRIDAVEQPTDPSTMVELEPNDSIENAVPVARHGVIAGTLYNAGDVDRFHILPQVGPVRVEVLTTGATQLHVASSEQGNVVEGTRGDDGIYRICRLMPDDVRGAEVRVAYLPNTQATDGVYQLTVRPAADGDMEHEPNAAIAVPDGLPWGPFGFAAGDRGVIQAVAGGIFPADDVDQWLFHVPAQYADRPLTIRAVAHGAMNIRLRVLDGDRVQVASADRGGIGQSEEVKIELPAGYYVVEVAATGANGCDATYALEAEVEAGAPARDTGDAMDGRSPQVIQRVGDLPLEVDGASKPGFRVPDEPSRPPQRPASADDSAPDYPW